MLVIYQVTEDIYQGVCGFDEIGVFSIPDGLTKEEIKAVCKKHCKPIVNRVIISNDLEFEYECADIEWGGDWNCYKVRDDVNLSEKEIDDLLDKMGYEDFKLKYCINKDISY